MRNFIGVDLGGTNIRAAIVSEDGTIKCMKKSESHPERGAEAVMETMISLIESLDGYEDHRFYKSSKTDRFSDSGIYRKSFS